MGRKNNPKGPAIFISVLILTVVSLAIVLTVTLGRGSRLRAQAGDAAASAEGMEPEGDARTADVEIIHTGKDKDIRDPDNREIDFAALKAANPDVFAWIYVPGTDIDCAVVTDNDDPEYYLSNDIEGMEGVFMQSYNSKGLTDRMSVIYGKKDKEGKSEFTELFKFQDADFYKEHKYIYVYTETGIKKYKIFAAHRALASHLMLGYDWDVDQIYLDYLIEVLESREMGGNIDRDVEISTDDKVLTLSERVSDDENKRFLVQGVLVK